MRGNGFAGALLIAASLAGPAAACRFSADWNEYGAFVGRRTPAIFNKATFVERVEFETPAPAKCPRYDPEKAVTPSLQDPCENPFANGLVLTAKVVERFKGYGGDRYLLVHRDSFPAPVLTGTWKVLVDPRTYPAAGHAWLAISQKARADDAHASRRFWDSGELGPAGDGWNSCMRAWFIDYGLPHIVFRDSEGGMIAAEPVDRFDDALILRLREARDSGAYKPPEISPETFFRAARSLAHVRIERCDKSATTVKIIRWAGEKVEVEDWTFLRRWSIWRGERCTSKEVLVAFDVFSADPNPSIDLAWGLKAAPEADPSLIAKSDFDWPGNDLPRPMNIERGSVKVSEIPSGFAITGGTISVDEAFRLFAEQRP